MFLNARDPRHTRSLRRGLISAAAVLVLALPLAAHPGSGIFADHEGNIYFVDTGSGVYKVEKDGKLTRLPGPAYHWMAGDPENRLKDVRLPYFSSGGATVSRVGDTPTLLLSSDFPVATGPKGDLFYPWLSADKELQIFRLQPDGNTSTVLTLPSGSQDWLNGLVVGRDGSICYTEDTAVRKVTPQGKVLTVVEKMTFEGCETIPGMEKGTGAYFRGIDVDGEGSIYVAATGCGRVIRISTDGNVTTMFQSTSPWAPTGVAVSGDKLCVLEYLHTVGDDRSQWIPRVRTIGSDGKTVIVAAITR